MTNDGSGTVGRPVSPSAGWLAGGFAASSVAAVALLLPWAALGRRQFSSLDLVSTASALEIIEGGQKRLVVVCWMIIPVLVAAGYVLAATGRRRSFACALLPLGPIYVVAVLGISANTPATAEWGLQLGVVAGIVSTIIGVMLLVVHARAGTPRGSVLVQASARNVTASTSSPIRCPQPSPNDRNAS